MLLPHTFFTGAVTPKYSFSSNQLLNWNSFQFRKLKRFTQRGQWLRPCPLLKAAGGHLSVWFRCRCSQWHWNLGAEGPEPSLRAQPVGGPRAYGCSTPAFQEQDNTLRPVELLIWINLLTRARTCRARPVNCGHLFLHCASRLGFVGWTEVRCSQTDKGALEREITWPSVWWMAEEKSRKAEFSLATSKNTNGCFVPDICVCSKESPRKEALAFLHLEAMKKAWELSLLFT